MLALSNTFSNANISNVKFAFFITDSGTLQIYENGTPGQNCGSYAENDKLKIAIEDNKVNFYKNNELLYTSTAIVNYPLLAEVIFYSPGSAFYDVKLGNFN